MTTREDCRRICLSMAVILSASAMTTHLAHGEGDESGPALGGFCPVSYIENDAPVMGDAKHKSTHVGHVYHLSSAEAKKRFDASPESFLPQYDGRCTMALGGPYGNRFAGDPKVFMVKDGKLYLFSSGRAKRAYEAKPDGVLEKAAGLFEAPRFNGQCLVSYQTQEKPVKGDSSFHAAHDGYTYHFASAETLSRFVQNPPRYIPQYRGYCATHIAGNIREDGDAQFIRALNDRTFLFKDADALSKFDANPAGTIERADAKWAVLKTY